MILLCSCCTRFLGLFHHQACILRERERERDFPTRQAYPHMFRCNLVSLWYVTVLEGMFGNLFWDALLYQWYYFGDVILEDKQQISCMMAIKHQVEKLLLENKRYLLISQHIWEVEIHFVWQVIYYGIYRVQYQKRSYHIHSSIIGIYTVKVTEM